jgi:nucleotide-binding universal stress UspA family protein
MSVKILLAIDGSPCSDAAVEEVTRRPWPAGSSLKVLTVFEPPVVPTPETWAVPASYYEEIDAALRKQGQNIIDSALQKLKANKTLSLTSLMMFGSPRSVIVDEAESWGADLIVVGSHGYSTWKRLLLGSVSQAVVSHAKCSVEVVRRQAAEKASTDQLSEKSKG